MQIKISPSDLCFLFDESPWGFYCKYREGIPRVPGVFPRIFSIIDELMKKKFTGVNLSEINPNLPNGMVSHADSWVMSTPIINPDYPDIEIVLRGKIDSIVSHEDGSYSVIDFKTSEINPVYLEKYKLQLSSYAYSILNCDDRRSLSLKNVDKIGLMIFEPDGFAADKNDRAGLKGSLKYINYQYNEDEFLSFIKNQVIPLLAGPQPKPSLSDEHWLYLKRFGFEYEKE